MGLISERFPLDCVTRDGVSPHIAAGQRQLAKPGVFLPATNLQNRHPLTRSNRYVEKRTRLTRYVSSTGTVGR
jgi:hypothetical protein